MRSYVRLYTEASKTNKGGSSGEVCAVTEWSRDNARQRLVSAARRTPDHRKS